MSDLSIFYDMAPSWYNSVRCLRLSFFKISKRYGPIWWCHYCFINMEAGVWSLLGRIFLWIYRKRLNQGATLVMGLFSCTKFLLNRIYPRKWKTSFCFCYNSYKPSSGWYWKVNTLLKNLIFGSHWSFEFYFIMGIIAKFIFKINIISRVGIEPFFK